MLQQLTATDLSHATFPFLHARQIHVGLADALVIRASFTGELGYEIYVASHNLIHVYERLRSAGADHGLKLFGVRALHSMRMEKGYGSWGRDFTADYNAAEADWGRFVKFDKGDFIGRAAAEKQFKEPLTRKISLIEVAAKDLDIMGAEPIFAGGKAVARVTSGYFGYSTGKQLALAYLPMSGDSFEIEVMGKRVAASRLKEAPFDPTSSSLRS